MSRRTLMSLAASAIVGIVLIATISTDASARRGGGGGRAGAGIHHGGVHRGGVYRGGVYRGAAVRRGVTEASVLLPSVQLLQEHMEPNAADTIPTHRATRVLAAVIERSVTAAPITAPVPVS